MKKIIVFGASGGTGLQIVKQALEAGYEVTAILPNPYALPLQHPNLKIIHGDVMQPETFKEAVKGNDAVISALGTGSIKPTTLYSAGVKNIIAEMEKNNVQRLLCISAGGLDVNPKNNFLIRLLTKLLLQRILKEPYKDMCLMEKEVEQTGLNYTIIRPPRLKDAQLTGKYRVKINDNLENTSSIARADLAHYIVHHIEDRQIFKSIVHVSY